MKQIFTALFVLAAATIFAGEKRDAAMKQISEHFADRGKTPWTWVFYGDSITHGAKHTYGWRSFTEIFHERVRGEYLFKNDMVINAGSSGYTTKELLKPDYYERMVGRFRPQVVFLLIGMNDAANPDPGAVNGFSSRLDELIGKLQATGAIVILQTYNTIELKPQIKDYVSRYNNLPAYNQAIRNAAEKYDLILIDHDAHWRKYAADPEVLHFWLGETIHPGARGHLEMANLILQELNIYAPGSFCSSVAAGGQMKISANGVLMKSNFNDFKSQNTSSAGRIHGGTWQNTGSAGSFTIVNEGVNNSPCLKILRDGAPGQYILRAAVDVPDGRNYKVSFKLKVDPNNGTGLIFFGQNLIAGGALFVAGTPVRGYDAKGAWQPSGVAGNFPAGDWVNCEINFNAAEKNYTISVTSADGKKNIGTVKHPFMKNVKINEVRFCNITPQKNFSLVDDFEFTVK